jgi:hypothetical protein
LRERARLKRDVGDRALHPHQVINPTINPTNPSLAGDEDDYANNSIPNIPASLQGLRVTAHITN